jgi:hypothetical protein
MKGASAQGGKVTGHDHFLPNPFELTVYQSSNHSTLYIHDPVTESVVKQLRPPKKTLLIPTPANGHDRRPVHPHILLSKIRV